MIDLKVSPISQDAEGFCSYYATRTEIFCATLSLAASSPLEFLVQVINYSGIGAVGT